MIIHRKPTATPSFPPSEHSLTVNRDCIREGLIKLFWEDYPEPTASITVGVGVALLNCMPYEKHISHCERLGAIYLHGGGRGLTLRACGRLPACAWSLRCVHQQLDTFLRRRLCAQPQRVSAVDILRLWRTKAVQNACWLSQNMAIIFNCHLIASGMW